MLFLTSNGTITSIAGIFPSIFLRATNTACSTPRTRSLLLIAMVPAIHFRIFQFFEKDIKTNLGANYVDNNLITESNYNSKVYTKITITMFKSKCFSFCVFSFINGWIEVLKIAAWRRFIFVENESLTKFCFLAFFLAFKCGVELCKVVVHAIGRGSTLLILLKAFWNKGNNNNTRTKGVKYYLI